MVEKYIEVVIKELVGMKKDKVFWNIKVMFFEMIFCYVIFLMCMFFLNIYEMENWDKVVFNF